MKVRTQLIGVEQALQTLKRKGDALALPKVEHQLNLAAQDVAAQIEPLIPVGITGNLRSALKVKPTTKLRPGVFVAMDRKIAPHAHLIEYGTTRMAARPYFRPGIRAGRPRAVKIVEEGLAGLVNQA